MGENLDTISLEFTYCLFFVFCFFLIGLNCVIRCNCCFCKSCDLCRPFSTKILLTEWLHLSLRLLLIVNTSFILLKISNISVQVVSAPGKLPGRRPRRKPIARAKSKKQLKKKAPFWNVQNKIILFTVFLFILAVIAWTLLWLYISELKSLVLWC